MPAKRTYDVDAIIISKHMSKREQKIFTLLKEWREYKFIAKQFNLAASDVGKIVRLVLCTVWDYEAPNYQFTITFNTRTNVEFTTEPQMGYSTC